MTVETGGTLTKSGGGTSVVNGAVINYGSMIFSGGEVQFLSTVIMMIL
jgi:hypothetical protein